MIHLNHLAIDCSAKTSPVFFYPGILCKIVIVDDEIHCRVVPGRSCRGTKSIFEAIPGWSFVMSISTNGISITLSKTFFSGSN